MSESSEDLSKSTNDKLEADGSVLEVQNSALPGRILRAAREELNYSLEQVAQELHLRPSVVLAMEEEKYDDFTSDLFLKGYFRSYCRLVNLHEVRMVELLESQLKGLQKDIEDAAHLIKKQKQVKKQKKAFISLLVLALVVGVISFIVSVYYTGTEQAEDQALPNEKHSQATKPSASSPLKTASPDKIVAIEKQSKKIVTDLAQESSITEDGLLNKAETNRAVEQLPNTKNIIKTPMTQTASKPIVAPVINVLAANLSLFEAAFSGDCWFKLVDAKQKTVFAELKRAGDNISYSGIAPFEIVLGDASKAVLSFNGDTINLTSHTANNGRAQLTLTKG